MERKITASTRALVTLAENSFNRNQSQGVEFDSRPEFFDEYASMGKHPDAIVVDMNTRKESRFDGGYFTNHHAISAWLGHESATHIFLQTPYKVFAYIITADAVHEAIL
ncbi:hypothetical protein AB6D66_01400 [Vibrio pomeroyi]|uniref:Uncharacterized protein n=1 Tax=Vibrio pomeroyi TaxID=198832 RepID=A0ABV4MRC9_9VIBR|nr:hypothetical protein [Vibrio atlanticus]MCZ4310220.1 hypothetical protein [Vibrio atlanticus]